MQTSVEQITPALAAALLSTTTTNRPISERTVRKYAQDMLHNRWRLNGQTVIIDNAGHLMDGQHRMKAIVKANKTVALIVVRNAPREVFDTIDSGLGRRASDVLAMEGYKNTNALQAAASACYNYIGGGRDYHFTRKELTDFIADHEKLAELTDRLCAKVTRIRRAPLVAVMFLADCQGKHTDKVNSFMEGVVNGEGLLKGDPRFTLREWADNSRIHASKGKDINKQAYFGAITRAWNAYVNDKPLTMIKNINWSLRDEMLVVGFDRGMFPGVPEILARGVSKR